METKKISILLSILFFSALFLAGCTKPGTNPVPPANNSSPIFTAPSETVNGTRIPVFKATVHEMPYDRYHQLYYYKHGGIEIAFGTLNISGSGYQAYIFYYPNASYLFNPAPPGKALSYPAGSTIYGFNTPGNAQNVSERFPDGMPRHYFVNGTAGALSEITLEESVVNANDYPFISGLPPGVQITPIDDFEVNVKTG